MADVRAHGCFNAIIICFLNELLYLLNMCRSTATAPGTGGESGTVVEKLKHIHYYFKKENLL